MVGDEIVDRETFNPITQRQALGVLGFRGFKGCRIIENRLLLPGEISFLSDGLQGTLDFRAYSFRVQQGSDIETLEEIARLN